DRDRASKRGAAVGRRTGEREGAVTGVACAEGLGVISLAPGTKVFLACRPVDLRNGFDGLAAKAQQIIGADPFSGHLFLFRGKRGQRATFYIQFAVCEDRLSLAPAVWTCARGWLCFGDCDRRRSWTFGVGQYSASWI